MKNEIARKKGFLSIFDFAHNTIWSACENYAGRRYIVISVFDNNTIFGVDYFCCENITELNDVKSKLQNHGFKIRWNKFNEALEHLS